ncbi:MAG: ferritin-like domain-containing protein [Myxococcota bacterium]
MDGSLAELRRSVLLVVGLVACAPTTATVQTDPPVIEPAGCNGVPIFGVYGTATGFVRCTDGVVLRTDAIAGVANTITEPRCTLATGECTTDADCSGQSGGACLDRSGEIDYCACIYSCAQDSDCGTGQICLPPGVWSRGPEWGTCVPATCTTNADCPSEECSFTSYNDGCGDVPRLACRAPADVCRVDGDCSDSESGPRTCAFDYAGDIGCQQPDCDIGRPFTDSHGEWRQAHAVVRSDWADGLALSIGLCDADRAELAAHWTEIALLEHASVASFARHTLELMALGAPSHLLAQAQRAAADEVRHATAAFGLARAFGGTDVGPGPIDMTGMAPRSTAAEILRALVVEGCIGETLGSAEARLSAGRSIGPVRDVLASIVEDETRHALLAWRTARWMLEQDPSLVSELEGLAFEPRPESQRPHRLAEHGLIAEGERAALHRQVWRSVIGPALDALVQSARTRTVEAPDERASAGL